MFSGITNYLFGTAEENAPEVTDNTTDEEKQPEITPPSPSEKPVTKLHTRPVEDDWEIVDQTRGASPHRMDTSPLEDLLIEHPSMSVYSPRGRPSSTGAESEGSESSAEVQTTTSLPQGRPAMTQSRAQTHRNRPRAVAARAYHDAQVAVAKSMQKSQLRQHRTQLSRHNVDRHNKVLHVQSANKHPRRRHHQQVRPSGANNNRKIHS